MGVDFNPNLTTRAATAPAEDRQSNVMAADFKSAMNEAQKAADMQRLVQVADATKWTNTTGGRSLTDGPTNGNWGGKCWSGGEYNCWGHGSAPPTDSGDRLYMAHDLCYEKSTVVVSKDQKEVDPINKEKCNATLTNDLKALPKDPKAWPEPPRPGTETDSDTFKNWAIRFFSK
ncbi:MAG: hypothetical protein FWD68_17235 [Alphaproteobacteria bacterium]|nr:hypothetical protein [Alphaproteobacteria bacterium]